MSDSRKRFEEWAKGEGFSVTWDEGEYDFVLPGFHASSTHHAYMGWSARDSEVERLKEDAERYRWLRDRAMHAPTPCPWVVFGNDGNTADPTYGRELDAVVDAALLSSQDKESA